MLGGLKKNGHALKVHVKGQLVFTRTAQTLNAALDGFGLAYAPEDMVQPYIEAGQLQCVLADWCPSFSGYHLYYPHRRHTSRAFTLLIEALRYHQT